MVVGRLAFGNAECRTGLDLKKVKKQADVKIAVELAAFVIREFVLLVVDQEFV